ncbi:MAG: hypothetical protein NW215_10525 [Hyphomicrobiales bacterium]|nr:hypothetical protein [Hyphomicrobiales bacterium]
MLTPISQPCRDEIAAAGLTVIGVRTPESIPPDYCGQCFVIVEHDGVRWWSVADICAGVVTGPWEYFTPMRDARVLAVVIAPPVDDMRTGAPQ